MEIIKKMLLTGVLILVAPGTSDQIMFGVLIAVTYLLLVLRLMPYEDDMDDVLQFVTTAAIFLTLLAELHSKPAAWRMLGCTRKG